MPRFDKTGPMGKGPRTGRGMGLCKVPTDEMYEPEEQVKKAKSNGVADGEKIVKNILGGK